MSINTEALVNACTGNKNDFVDTGIGSGLKDIEGSGDIEIPKLIGVFLLTEFMHAMPRRYVYHHISAWQGLSKSLSVRYRCIDELCAVVWRADI